MSLRHPTSYMISKYNCGADTGQTFPFKKREIGKKKWQVLSKSKTLRLKKDEYAITQSNFFQRLSLLREKIHFLNRKINVLTIINVIFFLAFVSTWFLLQLAHTSYISGLMGRIKKIRNHNIQTLAFKNLILQQENYVQYSYFLDKRLNSIFNFLP